MIGIYKITNKINNKFYIGMAEDIEKRWIRHKNLDNHSCIKLHRAMKKYGVENFIFEIIEECSSQIIAWEKERFWIKELKARELGYNINEGGHGGDTFYGQSLEKQNEIKEKIRKANSKPNFKLRGRIQSEEERNNRRKPQIGNKNACGKRTEKQRKNISDSLIGKTWEEKMGKEKSDIRKEKAKGNKYAFGHKKTEEVKFKCGNSTRNKIWWTNGKNNIIDFNCPEGFWKGRTVFWSRKGIKNK